MGGKLPLNFDGLGRRWNCSMQPIVAGKRRPIAPMKFVVIDPDVEGFCPSDTKGHTYRLAVKCQRFDLRNFHTLE